ncbi:MAG: hypothetical protein KC421_17995 [Anaerolineales bacterium]|nr:hypothetical protein [Anaerolineales bacterium]
MAKRFAKNKAVSIKKEDDHERISLAKQKKLPEGKQLKVMYRVFIYPLQPTMRILPGQILKRGSILWKMLLGYRWNSIYIFRWS